MKVTIYDFDTDKKLNGELLHEDLQGVTTLNEQRGGHLNTKEIVKITIYSDSITIYVHSGKTPPVEPAAVVATVPEPVEPSYTEL